MNDVLVNAASVLLYLLAFGLGGQSCCFMYRHKFVKSAWAGLWALFVARSAVVWQANYAGATSALDDPENAGLRHILSDGMTLSALSTALIVVGAMVIWRRQVRPLARLMRIRARQKEQNRV